MDISEIIRFDDRLTVRINKKTKKLFLAFCEQNGISACQFLHSVLNAALTGVSVERLNVSKSPTINLTIERRVQRIRRYAQDYIGADGEMDIKKPHCAECSADASFRLEKEGRGWVYSCSAHRKMFKNRGFIQELTI